MIKVDNPMEIPDGKIDSFALTPIGHNLMCPCGNDELVLVQALSPFNNHFVILCRKCNKRGDLSWDNRNDCWNIK